jgi:hypothetical protein
MRFVETTVFTRQVTELLGDEENRALQLAMMLRPDTGAMIRGSGGLRKLRWSRPGSGKRGGIRVIYHWDPESETFFMLFAYPKNVQDDLTPSQLHALRLVVRREFG